MKSTIRVDFKGQDAENGQGFEPVIRVNLEDSEDVRDGLLKALFQSLGGKSSWLAVDFQSYTIDGIVQPQRITISPVRPDELEETSAIISNRLGKSTTPEFFSRYSIGHTCSFTTPKAKDYAYEQAKLANPGVPDEDIEYIPDYFWGKIVAVKFTEAKVWYDVLDDYSGKVFEQIPSHDIKTFSEEVAKQVVKQKI